MHKTLFLREIRSSRAEYELTGRKWKGASSEDVDRKQQPTKTASGAAGTLLVIDLICIWSCKLYCTSFVPLVHHTVPHFYRLYIILYLICTACISYCTFFYRLYIMLYLVCTACTSHCTSFVSLVYHTIHTSFLSLVYHTVPHFYRLYIILYLISTACTSHYTSFVSLAHHTIPHLYRLYIIL